MSANDPRGCGWACPAPTVDIIIEIDDGGIVLIERRDSPHGWALPGGVVEYGETLAASARREAREETSLEVELTELFHCYSDPRRDARRHTISTVFLARAKGTPRGGDDAANAAVFTEAQLPFRIVFDHATILADYFEYRRTGRRPPPER
ncbi:MAG: NUDIX hydrolase [Deltaproteobacteria bacterium]|nr:NUDIX hydrolase [Deltaproteobacteria bacterium]